MGLFLVPNRYIYTHSVLCILYIPNDKSLDTKKKISIMKSGENNVANAKFSLTSIMK